MTPDQALSWLQQVGGALYHSRHAEPGHAAAWVAVVRTPWSGARRGKLIIALGSSMQEAAVAAEGQWQKVWQEASAAPH